MEKVQEEEEKAGEQHLEISEEEKGQVFFLLMLNF